MGQLVKVILSFDPMGTRNPTQILMLSHEHLAPASHLASSLSFYARVICAQRGIVSNFTQVSEVSEVLKEPEELLRNQLAPCLVLGADGRRHGSCSFPGTGRSWLLRPRTEVHPFQART